MNFKNASVVEQVVWQMKLADYNRGLNRAAINDLFNGAPPYTPEEVRQNNIATNVNFLEPTKLAHDARRQFYNAFLKPGGFFSVTVDTGPRQKRQSWGVTITKEMNRCMKQSLDYFECMRSTFASVVLHGIGPVVWEDRELWLPEPKGVESIMVPSNTLLTFKNLPFFAVYRQYTGAELWRLTHGPKVDPAWDMEVVDEVLKWVDKETQKLSASSWPEVWSPERMSERIKSDGGLYASDAVPTIDCWDFYFWNDEMKEAGWNRRIILDAWGSPGVGGVPTKNKLEKSGQFLYNPGDRVYARKINEIIHFQFGDLSAVAPFRYHSVRSLGFLLFAVCHLQNRLRCKFNDAVFEHMLQYFRVSNPADTETALKINLVDKTVIDSSVEFIKAQDRWQINQGVIESGLAHNQQVMGGNAVAFVQNYATGVEKEKTATQVMAEQNSATALVNAALLQAYAYQVFQYQEIARRFCIKNSRDSAVRKFRVNVLKAGIPEYVLNCEAWDITPERVVGAGNKMMEMAIADKLMAAKNLYDPEPQREILRLYTLSNTDDPGLTESLVPEVPVKITDSVHDAQLAAGVLMQGMPVALKTGMNHIEYVEAMMGSMMAIIQKIERRGGMATMEEIVGLQNMAAHIGQHIQIIAQDESEKSRVKQYGDQMGKMGNLVKAYAQRLQEQMQKQAQTQGGPQQDPTLAAKAQATVIQAQTKAELTQEAHKQRTAQRQAQWQLEQQRKEEEHAMKMRQEAQQLQVEKIKDEQALQTQAEKDALEIAKADAMAARQVEASAKKTEQKQTP